MDSKQFGQYGRPLLNTKAGTDARRIERFGRSGYAGIQFDTTQVVEGMEDETPMPEVCGTIAPQVGVLYNVQGDEIPIYKVTLELHVDPEGLRALQESNAELCISDEPVFCGDGKWAQNGRIVNASPLRALLDAAEPYCTVWHGRLRRARSHPSLKALRGGRS
jgi:hypothetical protein